MKLIKLEQSNCNPCNMVSNFLDDKGLEYERVNVMDNPEVASKYGVMSVPVVLLLDEQGNETQRSVGFKPNELEGIASQL